MKERFKFLNGDICFAVLLLGGLSVYLSRIHLGYVDVDEGFYLTIPYRLVQGDSLLVDEWHVTQLAGFVIYPFMKLHLMIFKNTDGIYLAFRYIYLLVLFSVTIISYILLRKRDKMLAALTSIIFCLFTPFYLKTLSYNTIGLMSVWMLTVVLLSDIRRTAIKYMISGILVSIIVLSNPYMLSLYIIYSIACLCKRKCGGTFSLKAWGFVTAGAGLVLLLFLMLLFSRTSLADVFENIAYIFWDPAHESKSIISFMMPIVEFAIWFKWYFLVFAVAVVVIAFKPAKAGLVLEGLMLISMVLLVLLAVIKTSGIGKHAIMLPLTLLGGIAFAFTKEKSWDLFCKGWLVGIIYAVCMNLSSNQGIYVICNACTVSSCISIFLIRDFYEENKVHKIKMHCFIILLIIQILAEIYVGLNYVHWEENIRFLNSKIEEGPLEGIYTTTEKKADYDRNYSNIKALGNLQDKNILFFNYFPAGYLIAENARNASFSAWCPEYRELDNEKLVKYYMLHSDKIPEIIYVDSRARCDWTETEWDNWCQKCGYTKNVFSDGGKILILQSI